HFRVIRCARDSEQPVAPPFTAGQDFRIHRISTVPFPTQVPSFSERTETGGLGSPQSCESCPSCKSCLLPEAGQHHPYFPRASLVGVAGGRQRHSALSSPTLPLSSHGLLPLPPCVVSGRARGRRRGARLEPRPARRSIIRARFGLSRRLAVAQHRT